MKTTKNFLFALVALVSVSVMLVSCSDDDESWVQKSETISNTDSFLLEGLKSQDNSTLSYTASFSNFLSEDILDNLIETDFQNSNYGIGIFGLTDLGDTAKISNITMTIDETSYSIGSCYADNTGTMTPESLESSDSYLTAVKAYFNAMATGSGNSTTVKIQFSTNVDILNTDTVTLQVKYYAKYYYKYYSDAE